MKRAFIGLFGVVFGAILLIPSFLIGKTFSGQGAVSSNAAILGIQATGIFILVGAPLLFWIILPLAQRQQEKQEKV
ncbi:MAG: hypothetical protein SVW02_02260 [Candidatus Nanohaloarchaea archaeon]|nr:hypothetical protein [Candidatus Nanohaloarchaea archaeon]